MTHPIVYEHITTRQQLRDWYEHNSTSAPELWLPISRSWPPKQDIISYIDAVEVALCFGWIDSTNASVDGLHISRFSPRRKHSYWTELNKARCRRLIRLGEMTPLGQAVLPDLAKTEIPPKYSCLPPLYIRIRLYNIWFARNVLHDENAAQRKQLKLDTTVAQKLTYGDWNDHGRLSDDE